MKYAILTTEKLTNRPYGVFFSLADALKNSPCMCDIQVYYDDDECVEDIDPLELSEPELTREDAIQRIVVECRGMLERWESGVAIYRSIDEPRPEDVQRWREIIANGPSDDEIDDWRDYHLPRRWLTESEIIEYEEKFIARKEVNP